MPTKIKKAAFIDALKRKSVHRKKQFIADYFSICTADEIDAFLTSIPIAKLNQILIITETIESGIEVEDETINRGLRFSGHEIRIERLPKEKEKK